jgi:hypothetical protein
MAKSNLPCGCPESFAVYFGEYVACVNSAKHSQPDDTFYKVLNKQHQVKWRWVPAHWEVMTHKKEPGKEASTASQSDHSELSRNPVIGTVNG